MFRLLIEFASYRGMKSEISKLKELFKLPAESGEEEIIEAVDRFRKAELGNEDFATVLIKLINLKYDSRSVAPDIFGLEYGIWKRLRDEGMLDDLKRIYRENRRRFPVKDSTMEKYFALMDVLSDIAEKYYSEKRWRKIDNLFSDMKNLPPARKHETDAGDYQKKTPTKAPAAIAILILVLIFLINLKNC